MKVRNYYSSIKILLKFIANKDPIDNKSVLAQAMAWHWTGTKPLPEPIMTYFTDTDMSPGFNGLIYSQY